MIKNEVKILSKSDSQSDFKFWQSQSFEKRLETLEKIRQEYTGWKYADKPGFQRVYSIIKRK